MVLFVSFFRFMICMVKSGGRPKPELYSRVLSIWIQK